MQRIVINDQQRRACCGGCPAVREGGDLRVTGPGLSVLLADILNIYCHFTFSFQRPWQEQPGQQGSVACLTGINRASAGLAAVGLSPAC